LSRSRVAAPAAGRNTDLDDLPLPVEVVEHAAADNLAAGGVHGREREQSTLFRESRQVADRGGEGVAIEGR
jgi:hypothetical protein